MQIRSSDNKSYIQYCCGHTAGRGWTSTQIWLNAEIEDATHTPKEYEKALWGGEGRLQTQVQQWLEKTRKGTSLRFP